MNEATKHISAWYKEVLSRLSYSVCIRVAPDLAINPGSGHHLVVLVLQAFRPFPTVNGRQQSSSRIANVDFRVFATGWPDHGSAEGVVLYVECELPVVIVDFPNSGALIKVYGQQVPVMCLKEKSVKIKINFLNLYFLLFTHDVF